MPPRLLRREVEPDDRGEFADEMGNRLGIPVEAVADPRDAVAGMDILVLATSAYSPVLDGSWLEPGQHINAVGSHSPDRRELDTVSVMRSRVVADSVSACLAEAGDLTIPINEGAIDPGQVVAALGDVVTGRCPGRVSPSDITLFKSVGLAIEDAATAALVYQRAVEHGVGVQFDF